jgi:uncharacterized protein YbcC (UPF0753/DUF2309 family)
VRFFDQELIPPAQTKLFAKIAAAFHKAQQANAAERTRRFESAPRKSPLAALRHVEARAWDFREPRAECGHATNALSIIGRRELTRQAFFDRRAFLTTYDPDHDEDGEILKALLAAVGPVCAGINLEYYFSSVDPQRYGCGSKLPHNVIGLIGVVDGAGSDFRTGLPLQMTEIHEPLRLLTVIESDPDKIERVIKALPAIEKLVTNEWMLLACFRRGMREPLIFRGGKWQPFALGGLVAPRIRSSLHYCMGHIDHLQPAVIHREVNQ